MRYVRLECAGYAFSEETEANGLTLYGVGNGTTIDHIQVYRGADDGVEFFGGSVNVKYLIVTDCEDDSFDWTEGWNGKAQFLVADQRGTTAAKDNGDCLIEADNNGDDNAATPIAHPILANLTLIGNNSTEGTRGIRLREGTQAEINNAIVPGKQKSLTVEQERTESTMDDGTSHRLKASTRRTCSLPRATTTVYLPPTFPRLHPMTSSESSTVEPPCPTPSSPQLLTVVP